MAPKKRIHRTQFSFGHLVPDDVPLWEDAACCIWCEVRVDTANGVRRYYWENEGFWVKIWGLGNDWLPAFVWKWQAEHLIGYLNCSVSKHPGTPH